MSTKQRVRQVTLAAAMAGAVALTPMTASAAKGMLKMPEADWTGGLVTCTLIKTILENEMDYKVKSVGMPSGNVVVEAIIAGDLDFGCESWPSYNTWKSKYVSEWDGDGSVLKLGDSGVVGQSGYYVPRYMIEGDSERGIEPTAPDLKSYQQLNDYVDLFKSMESGDKGRLIGCPVAAWECMDPERVAGLELNYEPVELGSETAHWTEMEAAYKRGEPFLAYAWEPHWIHAKLDLVEVALPEHSEEAWPASDWPQDVTFNYGSPSLAEEHPEVAALITNMNLSNEQQAQLILEIDVNKREMQEVVDEWMAANEDVWRTWMP